MILQNAIIYEIAPSSGSKDLYDISIISTDTFNKMPFNKITFLPDKTPKVGDLLEFDTNLNWKRTALYKIHTYELATVLGKEANVLLLYGDKIGEIKLNKFYERNYDNNATFDIHRGDDLLLNEYAPNKFTIIHNITQSQIKYQRSLHTK